MSAWRLQALLDAGADVDLRDGDELTPLHVASANGVMEVSRAHHGHAVFAKIRRSDQLTNFSVASRLDKDLKYVRVEP